MLHCRCISPSIWMCLWGLFWVETRPSSKFCRKLFSRFLVILLTNQPSNKQTETKKRKLIGEVITIIPNSYCLNNYYIF